MQWQVPLADVEMTDADIDAIAATYRSGWLSMGPRIAEFEAAFSMPLSRVGRVSVGAGVFARAADGTALPVERAGYQHFKGGGR